MKIAILGAGAMGMLFGGYLSRGNDVCLIDVDPDKVGKIAQDGVRIREPDQSFRLCRPCAAASSQGMAPVELVIVFVKAMFSRDALLQNRSLVGDHTYVMSLQNGSGHEEVLREFVPEDHIILGATQHNSSILEAGTVNHGTCGPTDIGLLSGDSAELEPIAQIFTGCGLATRVSNNVRKIIWNKLFINVSASVLTGILQVDLSFLAENPHSWRLVQQLAVEAVEVANGDGMGFDQEKVLNEIHTLLAGSQNGYTSIYSDLRGGRKTEVDTISGSVVRASKRNGIPAPHHEFIVDLVHAMEMRRT